MLILLIGFHDLVIDKLVKVSGLCIANPMIYGKSLAFKTSFNNRLASDKITKPIVRAELYESFRL